MAKSKKRRRGPSEDAGKKLPENRGGKKLDPIARALLYADLVFLAVASILDANNLISEFFSGMLTLTGVILLLVALWIQFGPKKGGLGKGPRL